jgi:hypothetical protein
MVQRVLYLLSCREIASASAKSRKNPFPALVRRAFWSNLPPLQNTAQGEKK